MRTGGCLCGAVRYEIDGPIAPIQLCHCGQCRKAQGGAFAANAPVAASAFRIIRGEEALQEHRATPLKRRVFCGTCGGPIFSARDDKPDVVRLRVGGLDDTGGLAVGLHIQVASKAAWWPILDDHPIHEAEAPA